jgi:hypothetical protein
MKCPWCQVEFWPNREWQRFCSHDHQQRWHRHERRALEVIHAERKLNGPDAGPVVEPAVVKSTFVRRI